MAETLLYYTLYYTSVYTSVLYSLYYSSGPMLTSYSLSFIEAAPAEKSLDHYDSATQIVPCIIFCLLYCKVICIDLLASMQ